MLDLENVKAEATSAETAPRCTEIAALSCRNGTEMIPRWHWDWTEMARIQMAPKCRRDGAETAQ